MAIGLLRGGLTTALRGLKRRIDPRESVTGKLVTAGVAITAVATLVITVAVWQATTRIVTTYAEAQAMFRGGVLAIALVTVSNVAALALLQRSIVGGLRDLDRKTRTIVEQDMGETTFETDRNDEIGQLHWSVAELGTQLSEQVETVESLNRELATTATAQTRTLTACRQGDFTRRMDSDTGVPQFDALATQFNEMMNETEGMVAELRAFSRTVAEAAEETTESASEAHDGTVAVRNATESISEGVDRQHDQLEQTASAITDLTKRIDAIAREAESVAKKSERAASTTREGASAAGEALSELDDIRDRTAASVAEIEALTDIVSDVSEVAELISGLTRRTDRLAINTQVEAARGDSGGGTQLGKQIKRLAAHTEEAADDIDKLLESIEEQTASAVSEIENTRAAVERGTETIETTLGAFEQVETAVSKTADGVSTIDEATDAQRDRMVEVRSTVDALRQIGAETASEATDVTATARQQQATMDTIEQRLGRLSSTATKLEERLEQFTVRTPDAVNGASLGANR
jgi:methyl-accepting chemotaxis protein